MAKKKQKSSAKPQSKSKELTGTKMNWWLPILIGLFAGLLYSPSLGLDWVLDDHSAIVKNKTTLKGWEGVTQHFGESYRAGYWSAKDNLYKPLSLAMFSAEYAISPDNPKIHHAVNILLYALIGALVFLWLYSLFQTQLWALLGAVLYVAHPLHVEVVANIKSRDELLAWFFGLIALLCWGKYLKEKNNLIFVGGLLAFSFALFSKENAITLLAVFPAVALLKKSKSIKHLLTSILFALPVLGYLSVRSAVLGAVTTQVALSTPLDNFLHAATSGTDIMATAIGILGKYIYKLFLPLELSSEYGFSQWPIVGFTNPLVLLTLAIIAALVFCMFKYRKNFPMLTFGIAFFFITISIASNLVVMIGTSYAERLLFVPSMGWVITLIAAGIAWKGCPLSLSEWSKIKIPIIIVGIVSLFFIAKTFSRIPDWKDSYSLYKADIKKAPNSAKLNYHFGLENSHKTKGLKKGAEQLNYIQTAQKHLNRAIEIYPSYADAFSELGLLSFRMNKKEEALNYYQSALKFKPTKALTYSNMGIIYFQSGDYSKAEEVYRMALKYDPKMLDAHRNLAAVLATTKQFSSAITALKEGLKYYPNSAILNFYLGSVYRDSGQEALSQQFLTKAKRLDPKLGQ